MDSFNESLCILCLETTNYENCKPIDEYTKEVMDILRLQQNLNLRDKSIMCNECSEKLFTALNFKLMCMNTEDRLFPYISSKDDTVLDLKDIYLKEIGSENSTSTTVDHKVCRLCMQLIISNSMSIENVHPDLIEIYVPDVNFCSTKDPVLCDVCFRSLISNSIFLRKCLDTEARIKCVSSSDRMYMKTEEIEIKPEESASYEDLNNCDSGTQNVSKARTLGTWVPPENHVPETQSTINKARVSCTWVPQEDHAIVNQRLSAEMFKLKCKHCDLRCMYQSDLVRHESTHLRPLEVYKCDKCKYESTKRKHYNRHIMIHMDRSEVPMFSCDKCEYQTMYRSEMSNHLLRHKDISEVEKYQCDKCEYMTIFKEYYKRHQVTHKSPSELKMHKCDQCTFETKRKRCFMRHLLKHKDALEVHMFKCDTCGFQTRHKNSFSTHLLKHKDRKEIEMFRCNNCDYETKRKVYLMRHQLTHRKPSEVEMYKCDKCDFQSKHKCSLQRHQARH